MPNEMEVMMDSSVRDSLKKWGNFVFRLKDYKGKGNPIQMIKKDSMMCYGEISPTTSNLEGIGYCLDGSEILHVGYFEDGKLTGPGVSITTKFYFKGIWRDN